MDSNHLPESVKDVVVSLLLSQKSQWLSLFYSLFQNDRSLPFRCLSSLLFSPHLSSSLPHIFYIRLLARRPRLLSSCFLSRPQLPRPSPLSLQLSSPFPTRLSVRASSHPASRATQLSIAPLSPHRSPYDLPHSLLSLRCTAAIRLRVSRSSHPFDHRRYAGSSTPATAAQGYQLLSCPVFTAGHCELFSGYRCSYHGHVASTHRSNREGMSS